MTILINCLSFKSSAEQYKPKFALFAIAGLLGVFVFGDVTNAQALKDSSKPPSKKQLETKYQTAIKSGRSSVGSLMETSLIPGLSVAVGVNGQIVWSEGFGFANLETRTPVTPNTKFRLGSVSKLITAAAVARLYEEGRLDLDAPIERYVPTFPSKDKTITARQLAGHLAGIRHYQAKDYTNGRNIDFEHFNDVLSSLKIFQDDPLIGPSGNQYVYSTFGYTLLSQVIEGAAQQKFLDYTDEQIFRKLKMLNTGADRPESVVPNRTGFYLKDQRNQIINAPYVDSSYKWAGGGFFSTAEDLVMFGSAHLVPGFFKQGTLDALFSTQRTADGKETGVGIGWRIGVDASKRRILHHAGSINGGRSVLIVYPETGVVITLLSNLTQTPSAIEKTATELAEPFIRIADGDARAGTIRN